MTAGMSKQALIDEETELFFSSAYVTHSLMPPHEPDAYTTTTPPLSVGVSFTGHVKAIVASASGRVSERTLGPGTFGITGEEPVHWLRVAEPAEAIEVYPSRRLLERVEREARIAWTRVSKPMSGDFDPVIWAICARFRMAAQGVLTMSDLEAEEHVQNLLVHAATRYLGARPQQPVRGKLSAHRLARVAALVESRLADPPDLGELARAASMSAFHFQRLFRATTGMSPHRYVTARRMEAARRRLEEPGSTVVTAAARLGFSDLAHFRRAYRRQFGTSPRRRR